MTSPTSDPRIAGYRLRLYEGNQREETAYQSTGTGDEWTNTLRVRIPGFDGSMSVDLAEAWMTALRDRLPRVEQPVIGLETIVKFGNTMQLRNKFTAVIEIDYSD